MKKIFFTLIFLIICLSCFSQECMSGDDLDKRKSLLLDSLFPSALHADSSIAVFFNREDEFISAWNSFLLDFGIYLSEYDFKWSKTIKSFNKAYFNKNGTINTFVYNFRNGDLTNEQAEHFQILLENFSKNYKLKIKENAKRNFSQCGPTKYRPN